ncbi:MAG: hypothetical protein ACM3YE_05985 [Bacteroidota bacterium]
MGKHKKSANEVDAKEITDAVKRNEQAEFATEFPQHQPEKGMNKRQQRQKKQ